MELINERQGDESHFLDNLVSAASLNAIPLLIPSFSSGAPLALHNESLSDEAAFSVRAITGDRIRIRGKKERIIGTSQNDLLDASRGQGNNRLKGLAGDDILRGRTKDRLLGGSGNDELDTRRGKGQNNLKGGGGNDTLIAGKKDSLIGGGGNDLLDASKGRGKNTLKGGGGSDTLIGNKNDTLVGGGGADDFVIAQRRIPNKRSVIQDFVQGTDQLVIQNVAGITGFNDLTLVQQGQNTVIRAQGKDLVVLANINADQLNPSDFKGLTSSNPSISIQNASVLEGNSGAKNATFTVTLSQASTQTVTVNYATANNTAIAGTDYVATNGTLTFTPGSLSRTFAVQIQGDLEDESNEFFQVNLSGAVNGTIATSQAQGTILDDEEEQSSSRPGNQYSQTGSDAQSLSVQFNLVTLTATGDPILDTDTADSQTGVFPGAIEEFVTGSGQLPSVGDTSRVPFTPNSSPVTATLLARFVTDAESEPILDLSSDPAFDGRDTIEYAILLPGEIEPALRYRLDFGRPGFAIANFDVDQAINSLPYIFDNDLLNRTNALLPSGNNIFAAGGLLPTRTVKTYSQERETPDGTVSLVTQFNVVDTQFSQDLDAFTPIVDTGFGPNQGTFIGAVEDYTNTDTSESFDLGNLTASRSEDQITYTITSQISSITDTAVLDLTASAFDPNLAVNDLSYILENDLVQLAFFPN